MSRGSIPARLRPLRCWNSTQKGNRSPWCSPAAISRYARSREPSSVSTSKKNEKTTRTARNNPSCHFRGCKNVIQRPHARRPLQPWPNIDLELALILFCNSPARHVRVEIIFHRLSSSDPIDGHPIIKGNANHPCRVADQGNVESRLEQIQSRHLAPQTWAVVSRYHLKCRLDAVLAIPGHERLDVTLMAQT